MCAIKSPAAANALAFAGDALAQGSAASQCRRLPAQSLPPRALVTCSRLGHTQVEIDQAGPAVELHGDEFEAVGGAEGSRERDQRVPKRSTADYSAPILERQLREMKTAPALTTFNGPVSATAAFRHRR